MAVDINITGQYLQNGVPIGGGGLQGVHAPIIRSGSAVTYMVSSVLSFPASAAVPQRIYAMPFIPINTFTSASFFISCTTAVASALGRILIYSSSDGRPDQKMYESADLDLSTTGIKTAVASFSFTAGTTYFICVHTQQGPSISHISATSIFPIALGGTSSPNTYFFPTTAYPVGSAPTTFGAVNIGNGNVPLIGITSA